jgi:hypothetical protein
LGDLQRRRRAEYIHATFGDAAAHFHGTQIYGAGCGTRIRDLGIEIQELNLFGFKRFSTFHMSINQQI